MAQLQYAAIDRAILHTPVQDHASIALPKPALPRSTRYSLLSTLRQRLRRLGQRGVTFVEVLVVMALLSLFLVILAEVLSAAINAQSQTESYSAVSSDGRYVIQRLNYDIARASAVTTPASLGANGSSLALTIGGSSYSYGLNGTALQLTDPTGTDNLTGNGVSVSGLNFQRIGNSGGKDTVRYSFTLTSTTQSNAGATSQAFTSTAELR